MIAAQTQQFMSRRDRRRPGAPKLRASARRSIAVAGGQIVGAGHNRPIGFTIDSAHAEILCNQIGRIALNTYRLARFSYLRHARAVS